MVVYIRIGWKIYSNILRLLVLTPMQQQTPRHPPSRPTHPPLVHLIIHNLLVSRPSYALLTSGSLLFPAFIYFSHYLLLKKIVRYVIFLISWFTNQNPYCSWSGSRICELLRMTRKLDQVSIHSNKTPSQTFITYSTVSAPNVNNQVINQKF